MDRKKNNINKTVVSFNGEPLKDDEVLGILYGSQPEEILIEWIKAKLEK